MEFNDILAIAGMPGLYRRVGQHKNGLIVESLDGSGKKTPTAANTKVSVLADIAMYTEEGEEKLAKILVNVHQLVADGLVVPSKNADNKDFIAFMQKAVPNYDTERVYVSDIKKLANWYNLLSNTLDFEALKKQLEEASDDSEAKDDKPKVDTKLKKDSTIKNNSVKGDTKSKGKSIGTVRKMA